MSSTIFTSVYAMRGQIDRYEGFAIVRMHGCTFITAPNELARALDWARGCASTGNQARDRSMFLERIPHLLAPAGSTLSSRGDRRVLTQLVRCLRFCGIATASWKVPGDVGDGLESAELKSAEAIPSPRGERVGGVRSEGTPQRYSESNG